MKKHYLLTLFFLLVICIRSFAQEALSPITKTIAIKDVHIVQKPGQIIELGTLIIKNGLIQAVGKGTPIPANAKILEADSMYVYAGFIDGISHTGISKPEVKKEGNNSRGRREKDAANPSYKKAGIQPHLQVRDLLNPKDKSITDMRKLGYTAAHVVPRGKMLPGGGSLLLLNGTTPDDFIYSDNTALYAQLEGAGNVYPATLIAVMSKFRELYTQANQAKANEKSYQLNPIGRNRPSKDRILQAFYPVIDKSQSVFFKAPAVKDIHRVFTLQKELNFPLVLVGVKQGWHLADKIKKTGTPVLLSLDLPKDPAKKAKAKKGKDKDEDKIEEKKEASTKKEKVAANKKEKALTPFQVKQQAALKQYNAQAAFFQDKNIPFGFTSIDTKVASIRPNLRKMIANGLTEETALAALTTIPAKQLGVSKTMGTLEKGKLANLVISDKPYFEEKSNVRFVIIEGKVFEYEVKKKKKSSSSETANVVGTWNYEISIPGNSASGVLVLKNNDGNITGTITNEMADGVEDIQEATLDGNELTFFVPVDDTGSTKASLTLTIEEDSIEGSITIPEMGSFDVEGERVPE